MYLCVSRRFEAPLEPLQVLTWMLLLVIVGGFYSVITPALPNLWGIVTGVVYGLLATSTIVAGVLACLKDPIDPNVRRFHEVGWVDGFVDDFFACIVLDREVTRLAVLYDYALVLPVA